MQYAIRPEPYHGILHFHLIKLTVQSTGYLYICHPGEVLAEGYSWPLGRQKAFKPSQATVNLVMSWPKLIKIWKYTCDVETRWKTACKPVSLWINPFYYPDNRLLLDTLIWSKHPRISSQNISCLKVILIITTKATHQHEMLSHKYGKHIQDWREFT